MSHAKKLSKPSFVLNMKPDVISVPVRRANEMDKCPIWPEFGSGLKAKNTTKETLWEVIRKGTFW
jgi:hypothetical protein